MSMCSWITSGVEGFKRTFVLYIWQLRSWRVGLKYVAEVLQAESLVFKDLISLSSFSCCLTSKEILHALKCLNWGFLSCWVHKFVTFKFKKRLPVFLNLTLLVKHVIFNVVVLKSWAALYHVDNQDLRRKKNSHYLNPRNTILKGLTVKCATCKPAASSLEASHRDSFESRILFPLLRGQDRVWLPSTFRPKRCQSFSAVAF